MDIMRYIQTHAVQMGIPWFPNVIYGIMASMSLYLLTWKNLDESTDRFNSDNKGDIFDFIIVGAGSAGALVANRLSQNYSVLLLEAGGEPHPFHQIPVFSLFLINYPEIDWQFFTVPQKDSIFGQHHQESLLSAGKGLGGTSNINFMMHNRGHQRDYDNWAKILGDPSWSYEGVLPYFKKHEDFVGDYKAGSPEDFHGKSGEMRVAIPEYTGMGDIYLEAAKELGYNVTDLNGPYTEGFDYIYNPTKFGRRVSTHSAFLEPIRKRPNLTIRKYSYATKILFKNGTAENEAIGVEYTRHGVKQKAFATKEVILSAGAINSPRILMYSGVGPKDHLESVGITVKKDLPVGKNLQDHTAVTVGPFFINRTYSMNIDRDFKLSEFINYLTNGGGFFSSSGCNSQGFIASPLAKAAGEGDWADTHLILYGASMCQKCDVNFARAFNFKEDMLQAYYEHAIGKESFLQLVSNGRPHSRGEITLRSSNPNMPPIIDPKYLDNEHDIRVMVEGVKKAVEIAENSTIFQKIGTNFTTEPFPGCHEEVFRSDRYWECFVRQFTMSLHHMVGTCSMGKSEVEGGVVDTQLRVFGTKRLRVIDASVMPVIPVGNTNWPSIMIGEKGAAMILEVWDSQAHNNNSSVPENSEAADSSKILGDDSQIIVDYSDMDNKVKPSFKKPYKL